MNVRKLLLICAIVLVPCGLQGAMRSEQVKAGLVKSPKAPVQKGYPKWMPKEVIMLEKALSRAVLSLNRGAVTLERMLANIKYWREIDLYLQNLRIAGDNVRLKFASDSAKLDQNEQFERGETIWGFRWFISVKYEDKRKKLKLKADKDWEKIAIEHDHFFYKMRASKEQELGTKERMETFEIAKEWDGLLYDLKNAKKGKSGEIIKDMKSFVKEYADMAVEKIRRGELSTGRGTKRGR